jgi:hypothetical protein
MPKQKTMRLKNPQDTMERAAIHEASHVTIGFRHGYLDSWGAIYNAEMTDSNGASVRVVNSWVGEARLAAHHPPENVSLEFGIAGCIGEAILDGRDDYTTAGFWDDGDPDENGMSAADWDNTGIDPWEDWIGTPEFLKTVRSVGDYLKEHWSDVHRLARMFIDEVRKRKAKAAA